MKGLLLKEWYMIMKYCRAFVLIMVVFLLVSCVGSDSVVFIVYPAVFAGMIPVTLISYDEREKWSIYCETLPYSRSQLVSSKYLIGMIFEIAVFILSAVAQAFRMCSSGVFNVAEYTSLMASIFIIGVVAPAILLPFIYRFGAEKGRIAYYIVIGILCASTTAMMGTGLLNVGNAGSPWTLAVVCVAVMALYALSWRASILFYKKREL